MMTIKIEETTKHDYFKIRTIHVCRFTGIETVFIDYLERSEVREIIGTLDNSISI